MNTQTGAVVLKLGRLAKVPVLLYHDASRYGALQKVHGNVYEGGKKDA